MAYTVRNLADWKTNFLETSVQNDDKTFGGDFLSSESLVLFAGPPAWNANAEAKMVPIGLVQNVQVSQQKQINQLFEVGSRKPFFIPGRTMVAGSMSRILFDGPSLMYAMYLKDVTGTTASPISSALINPADPAWKPKTGVESDNPVDLNDAVEIGGTTSVLFKDGKDVLPKPGYFFVNLASTFFNNPTGLGVVLYDMDQEAYGGFYMENVYIQQYGLSVAAQQTILVESVSFRCATLLPIDLK